MHLKPVLMTRGTVALISIPIFGYLVLFNDAILSSLSFKALSGREEGTLFLSSKARFQCIYFGLVGLALASLHFRLRCPPSVANAKDAQDYRDYALQSLSLREIAHIYFKEEGRSGFGKVDDTAADRSILHEFLHQAISTTRQMPDLFSENYREELWFLLPGARHRDEAVNRFREFLSELFERKFFMDNHTHKPEVFGLTFLTITSLLLLLIPSIDLFVTVLFDLFPSKDPVE
jgi:hypothetical protein